MLVFSYTNLTGCDKKENLRALSLYLKALSPLGFDHIKNTTNGPLHFVQPPAANRDEITRESSLLQTHVVRSK